ncbi:MAG: hypothetical protein IJT15_01400 [Rickettsiales bacterium]|nr:hypothetical protein [Rickettsiales bacterium]
MEVEQSGQFPKQEEIDKAIDNWVEQLFQKSFFDNNKEEKIKTIFSTEIREYQSRNNNSLQSLNIEQLTSIVKQELQKKTKAFLETIKQQKQYNGNEFVVDNTDPYGVVLKTNDGQQEITLISFSFGLDGGLYTNKPPITPIIKSVNDDKYHNTLKKFVHNESYNKSVLIGNEFYVSYSNEKEYEDNKIDDTFITFNKDDNGQINNIKLSREWLMYNHNDGIRKTQNITEIKLQNNKISEIHEYKDVHTEKFEGIEPKEKNTRTKGVSIEEDKLIENKIKNIFSNKDDIAIQNILHELDEEQLKAITNNHEIDISPKSSSPSLDDGGCCQCNICNCNLDRLNCFSGIFNSKS